MQHHYNCITASLYEINSVRRSSRFLSLLPDHAQGGFLLRRVQAERPQHDRDAGEGHQGGGKERDGAAGADEQVLSIEIDTSAVAAWRESFPVLTDRRLG